LPGKLFFGHFAGATSLHPLDNGAEFTANAVREWLAGLGEPVAGKVSGQRALRAGSKQTRKLAHLVDQVSGDPHLDAYARWCGGSEYHDPMRLEPREVPADLLARLEDSAFSLEDPVEAVGEGTAG